MAFRGFQIVVGLLLGALASWMLYMASLPFVGAQAHAPSTGELINSSLMGLGAALILGIYYWAMWADSAIHRVLENIFSIPELLKKIAFTLVLLCIYRVGFHVPLPGLNQEAIKDVMQRQSDAFGQVFQTYSMFTGGNLQQSTLFGMGIMPYISASIIFQLLSTVVPALEKLKKEGPAGYRKIQEYSRYATVLLCVIQATFWMNYMNSSNLLYSEYQNSMLVFFIGVVGMTAGTMFMMWLGEQIDEYGIGNGISLLIMAGIVARMPEAINKLITSLTAGSAGGAGAMAPLKALVLVAAFIFVVAGAILITQGQRRIPIQSAKQMRGRRVYGGQRQYLPLRVNHGGVMPIIFASSLMIFPSVVLGWISARYNNEFTRSLHDAFLRQGYVYNVLYIGLIYFFAYFWTTVQFRPKEMAEQLRDYGSFIPGLRPGRRTADYLERVMERITYCGAAFLSVIAVIPTVASNWLGIDYGISAFLGGTGLLIVVSVALDLVQRIEANLVMRNYGGFLGGSTRIKGAYS